MRDDGIGPGAADWIARRTRQRAVVASDERRKSVPRRERSRREVSERGNAPFTYPRRPICLRRTGRRHPCCQLARSWDAHAEARLGAEARFGAEIAAAPVRRDTGQPVLRLPHHAPAIPHAEKAAPPASRAARKSLAALRSPRSALRLDARPHAGSARSSTQRSRIFQSENLDFCFLSNLKTSIYEILTYINGKYTSDRQSPFLSLPPRRASILRRVAYASPAMDRCAGTLNCLRPRTPPLAPESEACPLRFRIFFKIGGAQTRLRSVTGSTPNCLRSCRTAQGPGNPRGRPSRESRQSIADLQQCPASRARVPHRDGESSAIVEASRFPRLKPRLDSSPGKRGRLFWALSKEDSGAASLRLAARGCKTLGLGRMTGSSSGTGAGRGGRSHRARTRSASLPIEPWNPPKSRSPNPFL